MTTILIIEDELPIRANIVEMLELEGFSSLEAGDGRTGLQIAEAAQPDLIICDVTMPEMDGYEVLLELRKNPITAAIPLIFLTARADRSFMRHGMELGADDYLTKPFTLAELRAAISARLDRHQSYTRTSQDLEQAKRTLIQLVSHELRTPLIAINTATEIISRQIGQLSQGQILELIESIQRGGQRLARLVEQIVFLVQIETATITPASIKQTGLPMRISDLLIPAMNQARAFAYRNPDVNIQLDVRDKTAVVVCNKHALIHALAELSCNALVFSPSGSEVHISAWYADDYAWISIIDQGQGMTPEQLEHALREFGQIDRQTQDQQGIGLGLPLSRRIIQLHGGTFEIQSVVNKGTQVTISLPALPTGQ